MPKAVCHQDGLLVVIEVGYLTLKNFVENRQF